MNKRSKIILFLVLCFGKVFSQETNISNRIQSGDLTLFTEEISDLELSKMTNSELRLLRNMIYAKYGHIFNSEDLNQLYSNFNWYNPNKKVSDSQLTKVEFDLVKRITIFETRQETEPSINFGKEIIGIWHITPIMPSTWLDRFVISSDNKIEFLIDNFQKNPKISEYLGHYEIKGNTLIFYVEKLITKKETIELKEIQLLKFPITPVSEVTLMNGELTRKRIQIGSHEYFLFFGNPRK